MKEYLKMSDVFGADKVIEQKLVGDSYELKSDSYGHVCVVNTSSRAILIAHAINSHGELVAEVERLRGALQDAYLDGCHAGWDMSGEGYNAEYGGPEDGATHDAFVTKSLEYIK